MQDVSRVTGNPVVIKAKGREFVLSGMTFADLGVIQSEALKAKRARKIQVAAEAMQYLPAGERRSFLKEAADEAEAIGLLSDDEFNQFTQSVDGAATFFWVLFERQYPREFTRGDVLDILASGQIGEAEMLSLIDKLTGASNAKNSTGPLTVTTTVGG